MKSLLCFIFLFSSPSSFAKIIIIKPGHTRDVNLRTINRGTTPNLVINCDDELKCEISHDYVGKYYMLKMPNGKIYKKYKKEDDAINGASKSIGAKICDRLELTSDKDRGIVIN